jgi:hypothetical protein
MSSKKIVMNPILPKLHTKQQFANPEHPMPLNDTEKYSGMQRSRIRDAMVRVVATKKAVRNRQSALHKDNLKEKV